MKNKAFIYTCFLFCVIAGCKGKQTSEADKEKALAFNKQAVDLIINSQLEERDGVKDYTPCIVLMDSAIKYYPENYLFHAYKGQLYSNMGKDSYAIAPIRKSLGLLENYAEGYTALGMTYDRLGNADSARYFYEKAYHAYFDRKMENTSDTARYIDIKFNVPLLVWFLTNDADSARNFLYQDFDSTRIDSISMEMMVQLYGNFQLLDSALFPNGRASAGK